MSNKHYQELGRLVAQGKKERLSILYDRYLSIIVDALRLKTTVKKNVNVLQHMAGYFKKLLTGDEKAELQETIKAYHNELVPLIVPVTLIKHYVRKYEQSYLKDQYYLNPHPIELRLRNHV